MLVLQYLILLGCYQPYITFVYRWVYVIFSMSNKYYATSFFYFQFSSSNNEWLMKWWMPSSSRWRLYNFKYFKLLYVIDIYIFYLLSKVLYAYFKNTHFASSINDTILILFKMTGALSVLLYFFPFYSHIDIVLFILSLW